MPSFPVSKLTNVELSRDGRNMVLHFATDSEKISLTIDTMAVETAMTELGYIITKARELSEISKQGIVQIFRPARFRAELATEGSTVVVSFAHENGLESHFGLQPKLATELARQILDAAERGTTASDPIRH
jgi:hypothetical protein